MVIVIVVIRVIMVIQDIKGKKRLAVSHDQINMTKNRLEHDQKFMTMMNLLRV